LDTSLSWKPEPFMPSQRYTVQGQDASLYELYIAIALQEFNLEFEFQYAIEGGWTRAGGQVIDFMVHTAPLYTPLEVNEEYWHRDPSLEIYLADRIRAVLGPDYAEMLAVWGEECDTQDKARQSVRRLFIL
jgi:hypothetical protein